MQKALYIHLKTLPLYELFKCPESVITAFAEHIDGSKVLLKTYEQHKKGTLSHDRSNHISNNCFLHTKPLLQNQTGAQGQSVYH